MDGSVASKSVRKEGTGVTVGVNVAVGGMAAVGGAVGVNEAVGGMAAVAGAVGVKAGPLVDVGSGVEGNAFVGISWVVAAGWVAVLVGSPGNGLAPGAG